MTQANELRIGNKVQDGNGFIFDIVSIHDDGTVYCDFKGNEGGVWEFDKNNPCQGILLTEEILLKCEKLEIKGKDVFLDFDYEIYIFEFDKDGLTYTAGEGLEFSRRIKYLHEFQNLVFALSNKELQINF